MIDKKQLFRKKAKKKLQSLKNTYILHKRVQQKLSQNIKDLNKLHNIKNILFYMPLSFEPNILPIIKRCNKVYNCFIPFIQNVSFKMIPFRHPFKISNFGTKESLGSMFYKKDLDLMIVPVLGYDSASRRIGFGKGMYDSFFAKLSKKPIIIFVQLDNIFSKSIITNSFDIEYDIYISPKITIIKK